MSQGWDTGPRQEPSAAIAPYPKHAQQEERNGTSYQGKAHPVNGREEQASCQNLQNQRLYQSTPRLAADATHNLRERIAGCEIHDMIITLPTSSGAVVGLVGFASIGIKCARNASGAKG